jgi:fatty-acyl-CoA synthase
MVVAFVSAVDGELLSEGDVIAVCRDVIAGYKIPKQVFVIDALPKNATGKVERGALRRMYSQMVEQNS